MNRKFLIAVSLVFLMSLGLYTNVTATTAEEVRNQISDINEQIQALDKKIAKYQAEITQTGRQKNTLSNTIKELTLTRSKLVTERTQIQKKINATGLVIKEIGNDIETKEESIRRSEASLQKMLYSLYQMEQKSFVEIILSKEKLEEISDEYNHTIAVNEDVRKNIRQLLGKKQDLLVSKSSKLDEQNKLNVLKQTLIAKETAVLNTKKEKDSLLAETKNKEAEYQKLLAEQIKKRDAFEKALSDYEDQLKFILNPKLLPKEGSGVLSWPLDYVLITQFFGVTSSSGRLYRSGSHSGVDFRASVGTPVKSMANGVVEGIGDTDIYCKGASFGKWVFIKYDNGLSSVYGHLSVNNVVKTGDKITRGQMVALSGNTGHTTGPHLHVSVYASGGVKVDKVPSLSCSGKTFIMPIAASSAYLDPMLYLPKATADMIK